MSFFSKLNPFKITPEEQAKLDAFKKAKQKETDIICAQIKKQTEKKIQQMNAEHENYEQQKILKIKENALIEVTTEIEQMISTIGNIGSTIPQYTGNQKNNYSEKLNKQEYNSKIQREIMLFENILKTIISQINIYGNIDNEPEFKAFLRENYQKLLDAAKAKKKELGIEETAQ